MIYELSNMLKENYKFTLNSYIQTTKSFRWLFLQLFQTRKVVLMSMQGRVLRNETLQCMVERCTG